MALAFAREGCSKLVLTSLDTEEEKNDLAATVAAIEEQGGPRPGERGTAAVVATSGDLADEAFRVAGVEAAGGKIGALLLLFFSLSFFSPASRGSGHTSERRRHVFFSSSKVFFFFDRRRHERAGGAKKEREKKLSSTSFKKIPLPFSLSLSPSKKIISLSLSSKTSSSTTPLTRERQSTP